MRTKIFRNAFLIGISSIVLSFVLFFVVLYQYFGARLSVELSAELQLAAQGVELFGMDYLNDLDSKTRLTWVDEDGQVIYDNQVDISSLDNHADRTEIQAALSNQSGSAVRYSSTHSQRTMYLAQRLEDGTVLRVASAYYSIPLLLLSMLHPILIILILCILLSLFLSARLTQRLTQPILELDLEHPEIADTYEELAPLLTRIQVQNATIQHQIQQLQQKQAEFEVITENMNEGFLLLDRQGHILSYNTGALHLLNAQPPEKQAEYHTLNPSSNFHTAIAEALSGAESQRLLQTENRTCQILANPVYANGQLQGAVAVVLDVTEREQREELRREFTANVSHELRTPLTSISGIAELLKSGLVRPEDMTGFAEDIYQEAQRLISLVGDIIRLSQLDEGAPALEQHPVNLLELCQVIASRLASSAQKTQISLSVTGSPQLVDGVPAILDEMVYNLCENAIKYNRPNGSVQLDVSQTDRGVELAVSDTGIGIPLQAQPRVFERFYRVDKSHSKAIGGTGLGLSIVKHGAAFHHAQIELESQLDVGTTIRLIFPKK